MLLNNYTKKILFYLNKPHVNLCMYDVSKNINITYAALCKKIHTFEQKGFVTLRKDGVKMIVSLTQKGKEITELLYKLDRLLK